MQFQTSASFVTLALAGALIIPQAASAACYSGADVKTTVVKSSVVEPPANPSAFQALPLNGSSSTQFDLYGDCYQNFVFKAYIGKENGTLTEIVAPNFMKWGNNHITLQVPELDPGDYLIELRTNPSVTVNRSLVTIAPVEPPPPAPAATAVVATAQTTSSSSYTDLATPGPAVTVTTGTSALVTLTASIGALASDCFMAFGISGATTVGPTDTQALRVLLLLNIQSSVTYLVTGLTEGSNTFTAKYRKPGGVNCTFANRNIIVIPQ